MKTLFLVLLLILPSCVSVERPKIVEKEPVLSVFPIKPELTKYSKKPIISAIDNNFLVTLEFISNSAKLKIYIDKIDKWKELNKIP